jgi:hypothetical protein
LPIFTFLSSTLQVPWAREGSGFSLMKEALMMVLSAEMPVDAMADLLDEHDTRLWRVLMHYVEQAHAKSDSDDDLWSLYAKIPRARKRCRPAQMPPCDEAGGGSKQRSANEN